VSGENKGAGAKKYGRSKERCKLYRALGRRDVNKALKVLRTLRRQPGNQNVLRAALKRLPVTAVRDACSRLSSLSGGKYHRDYTELLE